MKMVPSKFDVFMSFFVSKVSKRQQALPDGTEVDMSRI